MIGLLSRLIAALTVTVFLLGCGGSDETGEDSAAGSSPTADSVIYADTLQVDSLTRTVRGQTLYVPAYSSIHIRTQERVVNLTTTLSIRNTDPRRPMTVTAVNYYDSQGQLAQRYLEKPQQIPPLASTSFVVAEEDKRGGVGANFVVIWRAERSVTAPVVEAVMISARSTQGISFTSPARVLSEEGQ